MYNGFEQRFVYKLVKENKFKIYYQNK